MNFQSVCICLYYDVLNILSLLFRDVNVPHKNRGSRNIKEKEDEEFNSIQKVYETCNMHSVQLNSGGRFHIESELV